MELKDFIKETICSISDGIAEAQKLLQDKGTIVVPEGLLSNKDNGEKMLRADGWRFAQELEFEVNITIEENATNSKGGKLNILNVVNIGADKNASQNISNTNKIKFKIPIAFPSVETPKSYDSVHPHYGKVRTI